MQGHDLVELFLVSVERKTELAYLAFLALREQEIHHSIILEPGFEAFRSASSEGMQQIVVDVVGLQVFERVLVELHRDAAVVAPEVGHLRGDEIFVPQMP